MKKSTSSEVITGMEAGKTVLRFPTRSDSHEFIEKAVNSKEFHNNLVNPPLDKQSFYEYVGKCLTETERKLLIIESSKGSIAGAINFSQIFLKGFRSSYLGYYLFEGFTGRGLMTDALDAALGYGFETVGLHRVEANIQPENTPSINLVKRCGFTKEGFSRKYLMIGDRWRDHERWAIIVEDWKASRGK